MIQTRGLRLVTNAELEEAQLRQAKRDGQTALLELAVHALDGVLETLPDSSRACLWLSDAIELTQRAKKGIDG